MAPLQPVGRREQTETSAWRQVSQNAPPDAVLEPPQRTARTRQMETLTDQETPATADRGPLQPVEQREQEARRSSIEAATLDGDVTSEGCSVVVGQPDNPPRAEGAAAAAGNDIRRSDRVQCRPVRFGD